MAFMGTAVNNIQRAASMKGQAPTNNIINTINININIIFFQGQSSLPNYATFTKSKFKVQDA
jgi:hypothetical protein